jgi:hypothetical protein
MPCVAESVASLPDRVTQERGHEKSGDEHSREVAAVSHHIPSGARLLRPREGICIGADVNAAELGEDHVPIIMADICGTDTRNAWLKYKLGSK